MSILSMIRDEYQKREIRRAKKAIEKYDLNLDGNIKLRGVVSMGYGKHYEDKIDIFGNKRLVPVLDDVQWTKENLVILPGNQYVMCKMFNLPYTVTGGNVMTPISNVIPGVLNDANQMNFDNKMVVPSNIPDVNIHPLHFINGFMVGYGGATENLLVARDVNYKSRTLFQPVPFRYTSAELNTSTRIKYGGIVTSGESGSQNVKSYYIKKFDSDPTAQIYHLWKDNGLQDGTPVTNTIFDTIEDNGIDVESYAEIELSIDPTEVREYFQANLSGEPPRISELGLVASYWDPVSMDTMQSQLITHITFPTEPLHGVGSSIGAKTMYCLYRIYFK